MKQNKVRFSRSAMSVLLALCMLVSCCMVALIPTDAAKVESEGVGTNRDVYFTPYHGGEGAGWIKDNVKIGAHFQYATNSWASRQGSDTGRTQGGQRVYKVTVFEDYGGLDNLYFRRDSLDSNNSNEQHAINGWSATSNWAGKYYNGSSWVSLSYDTFKLKNNGNDLATFTNSSGRVYTATATLSAGTTYKLNVHDGTNYWANSSAGTLSSSGNETLYRYGSGGSADCLTITAPVTGSYSFTWTLNGAGSREDAGTLAVTFPTTYTVSYSLGSNVTKGTITGGDDNGSGTITAVSGSNVVINVSYASGYEYDSANSSLGGATASNSNTTFTFSSISSNKTISIVAKQSAFTVTVQAGTGGSISGTTSFTGLTSGGGGTITAVPDTANNYVFSGWTANPAGNITFASSGSATTTFEATGAATITANFTQETLYPVTVYLDGSTASTVNAGSTINPEITRTDRSLDDYDFTGWTLNGNVQLASGYSTSDPTIKISATGSGGTVTANYNHVDYVYFYAGVQDNWNGAVRAKLGNTELTAANTYLYNSYRNDGSNHGGTTGSLAIYNASGNTLGGEATWYYVAIFRVPASSTGKIYVGTNNAWVDCGNIHTDKNGYGYFASSYSDNNNFSVVLSPHEVTAVTLNKSDYDGDETITVSKTETVYSGTKTAGQDDFTYTYELVNSGTNAVVKTLGTDLPSSTGNYTFVPDQKNIAAGSYKIVIHTRDSTTGKIHNSCASSTFTIQTTPTQSTVSASATNGSVTSRSYTYKNGSATSFNNGASLRAGSVVTLTYTLNNGYTQGTTTPTGIASSALTESYNSTTRVLTITFTVPSGGTAITISHTASEITHSVIVKRRYYQSNGTTQITVDSSAYQTLTGVGISTAKSTNAAPTMENYTFWKFTLPSGVTLKTGDLTTAAAISVNATVDNATIYIDYKETLYTLTLVNQGSHGTIKQSGSSTALSSIQVGNVTGVTLVATPNEGYQFSSWAKTTNASAITIGNASSNSTTFKISGNATVTAQYTAVQYTISASGSPASGAISLTTTDTGGSSKTGGEIDDLFEIRVTVNTAGGYVLDSTPITFQSGTGYAAPTLQSGYPTNSGSSYVFRYSLNAGNAIATVHFKAATPTLSNVRIRDNTHLNTDIDSCTIYADNAIVNHYYLQPVYATASTDSFSTLSYATKTTGGTAIGSSTSTPCTINASSSIVPTSETGTVTYKFYVTATNEPAGVTSKSTTYTYTISVSFNNKQRAFFNLSKIYNKLLRESTSGNAYYSDAATQIANYNTAYDAATSFYGNGSVWPAYNDTASTTVYTDLTNALTTLMSKANMTTVYVLSNVANTATNTPVNVTFSTNGNDTDWKHLMMYSIYDELKTSGRKKISDSFDNYAFHTNYDGVVKNSSGTATYYMYTFSYAGRAKFQIWKGTAAADPTFAENKKLTGVVTSATDIGEKYYVDVYNVTVGSGSETSCSIWADFGHERTTTGKQFLEINETKPGDYIKNTMFGIQETGSVITSRGRANVYKNNTVFTIYGPIGKAGAETVDLKSADFTSPKQGKYRITYTTQFGTKANGTSYYEATSTFYLWVAYDDVTVYVDMNDNVGTPILNFEYQADQNGLPVTSGGTAAYLPYEMDLMTGSESVYKYTVKTSKLKDDYHIAFSSLVPLNICYITVENRKIGLNSGGFDITNEARISGEVWLKADSTHLTTFKTLGYGSVTSSFVAVTEDANHKVISAAVKNMRGTGIVTDDEEIFHAKYAASGTDDSLDDFGYVLNVTMNPEASNGGNTYYFDRWMKLQTPGDGLTVDTNGKLAKNDNNKTPLNMSGAVEYESRQDMSFTSPFPYSDGDGDYTYVALYKLAQSGDSTVRVEATFEFEDYDTSDGNYIYDQNKTTVPASYTKTIKVTGQTFAQAQTNIDSIVRANLPHIESNYFDYTIQTAPITIGSNGAIAAESKIKVTAQFTETPHPYTIILKNGSNAIVGSPHEGYYQQTVELTAPSGVSNPVWKDSKGNIIGSGATYTARYVASGFETGDGTPTGTDCQIIKVEAGSANASDHTSVVTNSTTTIENSGSNEILHHNFYIVDYCAEGDLIGGGVLFATGTYSGNTWSYRQTNAATVLTDTTSRRTYINGILNGTYDTEYTAQTINNVGFRYKPFKESEDVFRYSDIQGAYQTVYEGTNVNSTNYAGQKLRLFSFMVYKTVSGGTTTYTIVPSEGYGEVDRYIAH